MDGACTRRGSDGLVICALSGGVDSAVAAALVHRAVGDRLTCIYVDHGLMRQREFELSGITFARDLGIEPRHGRRPRAVPAALAGVEDPEQKRKIIGDEFIRVFEEEAASYEPDRLPDAGHALPGRHRERHVRDQGAARRSRRHHNVGGLPGGPPVPADRAAALPVQGRGPRGRRGAGPARGDGAAASPSRGRVSRSGSSARSPPSGWTPFARPTGSSSTRSRRPGCTDRSGSRSRS